MRSASPRTARDVLTGVYARAIPVVHTHGARPQSDGTRAAHDISHAPVSVQNLLLPHRLAVLIAIERLDGDIEVAGDPPEQLLRPAILHLLDVRPALRLRLLQEVRDLTRPLLRRHMLVGLADVTIHLDDSLPPMRQLWSNVSRETFVAACVWTSRNLHAPPAQPVRSLCRARATSHTKKRFNTKRR